MTVTIVGAGFSGTLLALHMLRRCPPVTRVRLIERNSQFGRGQAYATGNPSHLLNVPAGRMSAFHDRPLDFLRWLREQPTDDTPPDEHTFAQRRQFGSYVRHLLNEELKRPGVDDRLELVRGDVLRLEPQQGTLRLQLDRDRALLTDFAVLAIGNFPPVPPAAASPELVESPAFRADPWSTDAFGQLDPDAAVLLIGTGLTTVDGVVTLLDQGHRGPIHALSRRGLLPARHIASAAAPRPTDSLPARLVPLLQLLRRHAREAQQADSSWQPVIDGLRPFTRDLWQAFSPQDRERFLRHLRPWWDVHRHRMPGSVADRIEAARRGGQFRPQAARILRIVPCGDGAEVVFRPRSDAEPTVLRVARVVNCSGPCCDYDRIVDPLVRGLLRDGLVRPDTLRLGLDVTGTFALRDKDGAVSRSLFGVGPITRGSLWEITAVPDIRRQCEFLAEHLGPLVRLVADAAPPWSVHA